MMEVNPIRKWDDGMRLRSMTGIIGLLLLFALVSARDASERQLPPTAAQEPDASAQPSVAPLSRTLTFDAPAQQTYDLPAIRDKIMSHDAELKQQYGIMIMGIGSGGDHLLLMARRYDDVEKPITDNDIETLHRKLVEYAGGEFPLRLEVGSCCGEGDMTGKITKIDKTNGALIVDERKKVGNTDQPEANWVTLTEDGIIVKEGAGDRLHWEDL